MKKAVALILALVMCAALSACGGQSKEAEFTGKISGEWINAADGDTYILNEDGTGKHDNGTKQLVNSQTGAVAYVPKQ